MDSGDSEAIRAAGWQQGSLLDLTAGALARVNWDIPPGVYVLATHDCDVVQWDFGKEPYIEIIPVHLAETLDGNYTFGANPRRLQFRRPDSVVLDIDLIRRVTVTRKGISSLTPSGVLTSVEKRVFASWLGARYSRSAFPDEFNRRVEFAHKPNSKILKSIGRHITAIYLATQPTELEEGLDYDLELLVSMTDGNFQDAAIWATVSEGIESFVENLQSCIGVRVAKHQLQSENNIPISILRHYGRWDYDSYTFRGDDLGKSLVAVNV